jgi:transketolase
VLHVPTLKPLDVATIIREAVATTLMRAGVHPVFKQIALPTLHDRYGISTQAVVASVKSWL